MSGELTGGIIAIIVALIAVIYRNGKKAGEAAQKKAGADKIQQIEEEAAHEELEEKRNMSWPQRVAAARERARKRREARGD